MKKRSKRNNPEQKTRDSRDVELGTEGDIIQRAKKKIEEKGAQPTRSKIDPKPPK